MPLWLDAEPIPCPDSGLSLAQALELGRSAATRRDRIIIGATIDASVVPDASLHAPSKEALPSECEVRLISGTRRELAAALLSAAGSESQSADARRLSAVGALRDGRLVDAASLLGLMVSEFETAAQKARDSVSLVATGSASGVTPDSVRDLSPPTDLLTALRNARDLIGRRDWSGLADTLEADLTTPVRDWQAALDRAAASLQQGH